MPKHSENPVNSLSFVENRSLILSCIALVCFVFVGCGNGSSSGNSTGSQKPSPDYTISVNPTNLTLQRSGESATSTVSIAALNGFTSAVSIMVAGLPTGVSASPANFSVGPGSTQQVTFTVAAGTSATAATISFQGNSGNITHTAQESLNIVTVSNVTGAHSPLRTQYVRTNSYYDPNSLSLAPPHFTSYDKAHRRFFVSNPYLNEIDVFDAAHETQIGHITVPLAWGLDISPLNGNLYTGTLLGDIYQIDTESLSVIKRYPGGSIGPKGYSASEVFVLSDGRLALLGPLPGILGVDGSPSAAVWDPVTNSLDTGTNGTICPNVTNIGPFAVSGDRTRVLVSTIDEGGGGEPICSYDPVTKQATTGVFPPATFVRQIIPSPDGTRFFLTSNVNGVAVFDAKTVQLLGQITGSNAVSSILSIPNAADGAVVSLDGKTLYLMDERGEAVGAWDTTSFAQIGWVSGFRLNGPQGAVVISAIDETGLLAGPTDHGVGFLDASHLVPTQPVLIAPAFARPPTGPTSGGTELEGGAVIDGNVPDSAKLNNVYVGNVAGIGASFNTIGQVIAPPSSLAGAVDVTTVRSDGGIGLLPEGFSYGPTILEVVSSGATADGGQQGEIVGYGFSSSAQVTIGGQQAEVTHYAAGAAIEPYAFQTNALRFTIPPGTAGTVADVTVTTSSGSATAAGAFHYTAAAESYPLAAMLQAGVYDPHRDLYYFTDKAQIQVLSRTSRKWLAPITLPGTSTSTQLLAISESPNGSWLAVSDNGGQAIYLIDPDNPGSAHRFPTLQATIVQSAQYPSGLAVTDQGIIYYASSTSGNNSFSELNTSTGAIIDLGTIELGNNNDHVISSPDGSRVYASIGDETFWVDTSNNQGHPASAIYNNFAVSQDLAVSGDGSTVAIDGFFADSSLNPLIQPAYVDWETWFPLSVKGRKLNQDGSILFQPLTDGVDLISRNTGRLLYRIKTPVAVANVYDALVVADGTNNLAVINPSGGVSILDLSSLPTPSSNAQPFPGVTQSVTADALDSLRPMASIRRSSELVSTYPRLKSASSVSASSNRTVKSTVKPQDQHAIGNQVRGSVGRAGIILEQ